MRRQTTACHSDAKPSCCYAFRVEIDTTASKDANSLYCDAINLTTVALSCEPDLPRASDNHHESRCWRNITCDSRATAPSTLPSKTSIAAATEWSLRVACRCTRDACSTMAGKYEDADRGSAMSSKASSKHFGFRVLNPRESVYQDSRFGDFQFQIWLRSFATETKRHPLLASSQYASGLKPRQNNGNNRGQKPLLHWWKFY